MTKFIRVAVCFLIYLGSSAHADSVHHWGHWQSDNDVRKQILQGADPADVTEAPAGGSGAGGTPLQPIVNIYLDDPIITQEGLPKQGTQIAPIIPPASNRRDNGGIPPGGLF